MIVEEEISGKLCRLHPDPSDSQFVAQWILTDTGEIKGLMLTGKAGVAAFKEFGAWVLRQRGPLKLSTTIESVARAALRWGFREFTK